jgi:3-isopropylmalate/(R)-2-methylmalate dehydratase large subunit
MGLTITEKILAKKAGVKEIKPDSIVTVKPDLTMTNDATTHINIDIFYNQIGAKKVSLDPEKIVVVADHNMPSDAVSTAEVHKKMRAFAQEQGIKNFFYGEGVCHQLMVEKFVEPSQLVLGADSHTCTYGALGAFASGIGSTDIATTWASGKIWLRVPKQLKFEVKGKLPSGVFAKDLVLSVIGDIGADGATYKTMEFCGAGVESLSVESRFTLCNMAVEAGAKNGIIVPDGKVKDFLKLQGREVEGGQFLVSDDDAVYERVFEYDACVLEPVVALPHSVDNVKPVSEVGDVRVDEAFLGSCTNGRIEDFRVAAKILKGKTINKNTRMIVSAASANVYKQAIDEGLIKIFLDAGAIIMNPNCSSCWGACQGVLSKGEKLITSGNRNFKGRVGSPESEIYLGSPATVACSALEGRIVSPKDFV